MRLPAKLSCALLACMCAICGLSAQTPEGTSGRVVDENGEAVAGAYLIAVDPGTSEVLAATATDAEGEYTLPTLPGDFILNVSCIGYESLDIPVEGGTQGLEAVGTIRMQSVATRIDEAVVTADAPKIERELGRFVMRDVSASPLAKGSSTYNFLKFMPMVNVKPEGGVSVLNRDANIRINGRGIGRMAEQIIKGIPADEIERIEITPTRKSSQSAQSQKATINIVLKQRPDEGVRVVATAEDSQRGPENSPSGTLFMNYAGRRLAVTSGVSASYYRSRFESDEAYDYYGSGLSTRLESIKTGASFSADGYINMDYRIAERHRIGAQLRIGGYVSRDGASSVTSYGRVGSAGAVDSVYNASSRTESPWPSPNWSANLNYVFDTDGKGSRLSVDLGYWNSRRTSSIYSLYSKDSDGSSVVTDDFLQRTARRTSAYAARADYRHIFDADNTLEAGLSANAGRVDYDYFYGLRSADGYESDPGRTNRFVYDDLNLAGYASYSRAWSDKFESEVGARVELYRARGTQLTDYGTVDRNDFGVYPTLSLLYMPSDAHELSLDLSTFIARPSYLMLNPFITYTSPTTCTQFNPDLKASRDLDLMFCYVLLDDYMLTVDYWYCSNIWTEFTLADGDMTRNFTANYGNSHDLYASLIVSKSLFKGRWNLSAEAELDYSYEFGGIEGRPIDNHNLNWDITLKNNVALSRRHNWYLDVKYQYHSASSWVAYDFPARQEMEAYLMKEFDRASLSIGVYGYLMPELARSKTYGDYAFTINDRRYITGVVTFSYTFGNKRARRVAAHSNQDIESRIQ